MHDLWFVLAGFSVFGFTGGLIWLLIALVRRKPVKRIAIFLATCAFVFISFVVASPESARNKNIAAEKKVEQMTKEEKAAAFKAWQPDFEKRIASINKNAQRIGVIMDGLAKGSMSKFDAYDEMNKVSNNLKNISDSIKKIPLPDIPNKDKEMIEEAIDKVSISAYTRGNAAAKAADVINDLERVKPNSLDDVKFLSQKSREDMEEAMLKIMAVKISYGLQE